MVRGIAGVVRVLIGLLAVLAALGFAADLVIHVASLAGAEVSESTATGAFSLLLPIYGVAFIVSWRTGRHAKVFEMWKVAMVGAPVWMRRVVYACFAYSLLIFGVLVFVTATQPAKVPPMVPFFSGFTLTFWAASVAVLTSAYRVGLSGWKCPNGHPVSPLAKFCDQCGSPIGGEVDSLR